MKSLGSSLRAATGAGRCLLSTGGRRERREERRETGGREEKVKRKRGGAAICCGVGMKLLSLPGLPGRVIIKEDNVEEERKRIWAMG